MAQHKYTVHIVVDDDDEGVATAELKMSELLDSIPEHIWDEIVISHRVDEEN